jgi:hypothetical protein
LDLKNLKIGKYFQFNLICEIEKVKDRNCCGVLGFLYPSKSGSLTDEVSLKHKNFTGDPHDNDVFSPI